MVLRAKDEKLPLPAAIAPETREASKEIARFFDKHLGK